MLDILTSLGISVVAGVLANYICKWLDGGDDGEQDD